MWLFKNTGSNWLKFLRTILKADAVVGVSKFAIGSVAGSADLLVIDPLFGRVTRHT